MKKLISKVDFWTALEAVCWITCVAWTLLVTIGHVDMADGASLIYKYSWSIETALAAVFVRLAK